jgi:anthranilate phosphoribosyltransferase
MHFWSSLLLGPFALGELRGKTDVTVFNDAAAFLAAEGAMDFKEGIDLAIQSIDSKKSPPYLRKSG